jgi:hypothetical protein
MIITLVFKKKTPNFGWKSTKNWENFAILAQITVLWQKIITLVLERKKTIFAGNPQKFRPKSP